YGKGERITTGYPILVNGKPTYFLQAIMPTEHIYSMVEDVLSIQSQNIFCLYRYQYGGYCSFNSIT
ncbi:MAG TPA: hypothetical protein VE076_05875, partial [Nitrososphaeraceae archaeon]|nr:hypothetical protein [Nitrososphaeraceae archaeon]